MGQVISATTRFGGVGGKNAEFLRKANVLLGQARAYRRSHDNGLALEFAYRAALRTAGARVAASSVASRKRKPSGAWEQLRMIDADGARWADVFAGYSRLRSRVESGLEHSVDPAVVDEFIRLTEEFLDDAEREAGWLPGLEGNAA